jgi:hypothetical protein
MLWTCGSYDGPCSGIASYDGKHYWFNMLGGIDAVRRQRAYALHPLTEEEFQQETERHNIWRKYIGYTSDFDENNNRMDGPYLLSKIPTPEDQETIKKCYREMDAHPNQRHIYEEREPIGYFVRWPDKIKEQRKRPATNVNWFDAMLWKIIKEKEAKENEAKNKNQEEIDEGKKEV